MRNHNEDTLLGTAPIQTFLATPIVEQNLRCTLVFDDIVKVRDGQVHLSLEIGNMKQVNHSINSRIKEQNVAATGELRPNNWRNLEKRQRDNTEGREVTENEYRYAEQEKSESKNMKRMS